jgi:hypothetical protein
MSNSLLRSLWPSPQVTVHYARRQHRTADKGWISILEAIRKANNLLCQEKYGFEMNWKLLLLNNFQLKFVAADCNHLFTLIPRSRIFLPWRWRRHVPPKRRFTQDLHDATSQKTAFFIVTAVKTSILTFSSVVNNAISTADITWCESRSPVRIADSSTECRNEHKSGGVHGATRRAPFLLETKVKS